MKHKHHTKQYKSSGKNKRIPLIQYRQFTIILGVLVLLFVVYGFTQRSSLIRSVLGARVARGFYSQATITLPKIQGIASYNVYYGTDSDLSYTQFPYAVRNIPAASTSYTIKYLRKNTSYQYRISAVEPHGNEIWFSSILPITNMQSL